MNEERAIMIAEKLADYITEEKGAEYLLHIFEEIGATEDEIGELGYSYDDYE